MTETHRTPRVIALTVFAALVTGIGLLAPAAGAGRFSTVLPSTCAWPALSQPFLPWADPSQYFLAPGGNFEGSLGGWTLGGGASVVTGNDGFYVGAKSDSRSLALPTTASTVTTPTVCVTVTSPTFRLAIRNNGNLGYTDGQLAFYLNFTGADGKAQRVKIAGLMGNKTAWVLSPPISFIQYITTPLKSGYAYVSFTVTPNDNHGNWQIDDLYIDPLKSH